MAEATETLILRGLAQGCTVGEVQQVFDGMSVMLCESLKDEVRAISTSLTAKLAESAEILDKAHEATQEASHEIKLAEKNIGNGAQASLASLAFASWFACDILETMGVVLGESDDSPLVYTAQNVSTREIYDLFWNVGGALRRDPKAKNFYHAFRQMPNIVKGHAIQNLTGMDSETWDNLTTVKDSDAIAALSGPSHAPVKNESRSKAREDHYGEKHA